MPGPQDPSDQAAGAYGRSYDPPRHPDPYEGPADRPARGSLTDLRQRLDRLPSGHPSSPYHDDGSRKPPVVRLKDLELPLPGEAGTGETEAHQAYAGEAHADTYADDARGDGTYPDDAHAGDAPDDDAPDNAQAGDAPDDDAPDDAQAGDAPDDDAPDDAHAGDAPDDAQAGDAPRGESERPESERPETGWPDAAENAPGALEGTGRRPGGDPPQIWADGSWEWKGQRLKPGPGKIADEILSRCRAAEGRTVFGTYGESGLTPAMRKVEAQLEHGHLVPDTEKFALKSADRFKEKLAKLIARNPDKPPGELAKEIHDSVRYTYLFEETHYFEGVWQVHDALEDQGYELEVRRNRWDNPEYKGVNTRWRDIDHDLRFEVQFHTPSSWAAKQRTHSAYEQIADPRTPPRERARLRSEQAEVSAAIPIPPRCAEIHDYRKEGC
jgi:hypothetical protein